MLLLVALLYLRLVAAQSVDQFLSLDCGGSNAGGFLDQTVPNITWQSDVQYISTGVAATVVGSFPAQLQSVRYFPADASPSKNCYTLPASAGTMYLLRAGFLYANYDSQESATIQFQIGVDSTVVDDVSVDGSSSSVMYREYITAPAIGTKMYVCLIRSGTLAPFINTLELRPAGQSGYSVNAAEHVGNRAILRLGSRVNFGERQSSSPLRFPYDPIDRIWPSDEQVFPGLAGTPIAAPPGQAISSNLVDDIPDAVMRTAVSGAKISYSWPLIPSQTIYTFGYWAELNGSLGATERRVIHRVDNFGGNSDFELTPDLPHFQASGGGYPGRLTEFYTSYDVNLSRGVTSTLDPLVCADELYFVLMDQNGTNSQDVMALNTLKSNYSLTHWVGDPCKPVPWDELRCADDSSNSGSSRVIFLDLSGRHLGGTIPVSALQDLSSLSELHMRNNSLSGVIPVGLRSLTKLTVLDLADNQLVGSLDTWMQTLTSL